MTEPTEYEQRTRIYVRDKESLRRFQTDIEGTRPVTCSCAQRRASAPYEEKRGVDNQDVKCRASITSLVALGIVNALVASLAGRPLPQPPDIRRGRYAEREAAAIAYLKEVPASKIESGLPDVPFGEWITRLVGADLQWELNDCGEGPRAGRSVPLCVGIERATPHLSLLIAIGNSQRGIIDPPVLFFGDIKLFDIDRDIKRLADLPLLLAEDEARRTKYRSLPLRALTQSEAERAGRLAPAQQIDPRLPAEPFETWLARSATRDIAWILEGCSGVNMQPQCVIARATWPDGSSALVTLDLELVQRGISDVPTFKSAQLYDRGRLRIDYFASLHELAAAIQSMRERLPR